MTLETVYYIVFIVSVVAGASFKLGYELGKHAAKK